MSTRHIEAEELAGLLARLCLTKKAAADHLKVDERTLYRWLSGTRRVPHVVLMYLRLFGQTTT